MQQIEVDLVDADAGKAPLAGLDRAPAAGIPRIDLGDDEQALAPALDGAANDAFGVAFAVHFGRIDQRHAEFDAGPEAGDFALGFRRPLTHVPGALAESRDFDAVRKGDRGYRVVLHG